MSTVEDVAARIRAGELSVDDAVVELRGVAGSSTVRPSALEQDLDDPDVPDAEDVIHLDVLRSSGVITPDQYAQLVAAMG
jgi:hypothetical protein